MYVWYMYGKNIKPRFTNLDITNHVVVGKLSASLYSRTIFASNDATAGESRISVLCLIAKTKCKNDEGKIRTMVGRIMALAECDTNFIPAMNGVG